MSNLRARIKDGLEGKFSGLANGFSKINSFIFGIQRKSITLIGGQSGVFKTTMCDFIVLNAIKDAELKSIELDVFYYSYEIDELTKKANWISSHIYQKYNIEISPEKIKGFGENRLNKEEQELVDSEIDYIESLFSKINFRFSPNNPTGIRNELFEHALTRGKLEFTNYTDKEGKVNQKISGYKPNNSDAYCLCVLDHFYLVKKERGFTTKLTIDKLSEYQVELQNLFGYTFINLQQFNQGLSSVERLKYAGADLSPQHSDFRDSTNPYTDSTIVIGLMSPFKLDLDECLGYNIKKLKRNFLMFKIIKNRLSTDNIAKGLFVNPKAGYFKELPDSIDSTAMDKVYKYLETIK